GYTIDDPGIQIRDVKVTGVVGPDGRRDTCRRVHYRDSYLRHGRTALIRDVALDGRTGRLRAGDGARQHDRKNAAASFPERSHWRTFLPNLRDSSRTSVIATYSSQELHSFEGAAVVSRYNPRRLVGRDSVGIVHLRSRGSLDRSAQQRIVRGVHPAVQPLPHFFDDRTHRR